MPVTIKNRWTQEVIATVDDTDDLREAVIQLAGPAGAILEACVGPSVTGALIHIVSCPQLEGKVPDFRASNADALADIKRLADMEPELS